MFCVIIATYNEAANIELLLSEVEAQFSPADFRIIVVDDDSPDGTASLANEANYNYGNIIVHTRKSQRGLGTALVAGIRLALEYQNCEHIITMDGDLSHDPGELGQLLAASTKADLVQGSRYVADGSVVGWPLRRLLVSHIANILCRRLLGTGLRENTTNFRVYSRKLAQMILDCPAPLGYEFMLMPILLARQAQLPIVEVGITFRDRRAGKSKMELRTLARWGGFLIQAAWRQTVLRRKLVKIGETPAIEN